MTEFVDYTPGSGEKIAVDVISGGLVQRVKVMLGPDGRAVGVKTVMN